MCCCACTAREAYLCAVFGGLVNSTATVAELSSRVRQTGMVAKTTSLCLVTTIAMFARNLVLAALFSPVLECYCGATPAMTLVAGLWVWRDQATEQPGLPGPVALTSPLALSKVLRFGIVFIVIQIVGTLLTRFFGTSGMFAVSVLGGLVSSASTTAAAATMAMHGQISPSLAGSAAVLASLANSAVNLPIVWRTTMDKNILKKLTFEMTTVIGAGILAMVVDRVFQIIRVVSP